MLLGRVYVDLSSDVPQKKLLEDSAEFAEVLQEVFGLQEQALEQLWDKVVVRHEARFGDLSPDSIDLNPV